jgi:hypothetical protein
VTTVTVLSLFTAILRVIYGRGTNRALWLGFAVFGWGTLVLLSIPGESFAVHYPPHALGRLALKMAGGLSAPRTPSFLVHLTQIVNCIFVWIMAGLGALTGWWTGSNSESAS